MQVLARATTPSPASPPTDVVPPSAPRGQLRGLLAAASLGAAALHFGYAPSHFEQEWSHGAFFLVLGWLQVLWAVLVIVRPSRRVAWLGIANLGVIGVWALSRTWGIPWVPDGDVIEKAAYPDLAATAMEAVIVVGCAALLLRRCADALAAPFRIGTVTALAGLLVANVSGAGFTPSFAAAHSHAGGAHSAGHVDAVAGPTGTPAAASPCEQAGTPAPQLPDAGQGHSHRGVVPQAPIDAATRTALAAQQEQARAVAARFPTVAAAEAGGYHLSTAYVPCIGAHYTNVELVRGFDVSAPSELLFDGTAPDAKLVGLSYLVFHRGGAPDGFAGPNDHWHQHNANGGLCFGRSGIVIGAESLSPQECAAIGGVKRTLDDIWMLHDWVAPGWECSWGVFAPECPELGGRVGGSAWDTPIPGTVLPAN